MDGGLLPALSLGLGMSSALRVFVMSRMLQSSSAMAKMRRTTPPAGGFSSSLAPYDNRSSITLKSAVTCAPLPADSGLRPLDFDQYLRSIPPNRSLRRTLSFLPKDSSNSRWFRNASPPTLALSSIRGRGDVLLLELATSEGVVCSIMMTG